MKKYTLLCEFCGNERHFSCRQSLHAAKKRKRCNKCKINFKNKWKNELTATEYEKRMEEYKLIKSLETKGVNNPMYGKSSYDVMVIKYGEKEAKEKWKIHNEKTSRNNGRGMTNKSFYEQWVLLYGKEIADKKMKEYKEKQSKNSSGSNNPMYGKPTPQGSGQGWKGHYKGWFFRSLRELSYMINVIEKNNYTWESGEKISIDYIDPLGNKRTYRPDFIINNTHIVEIKPLRLHNTPLVTCKSNAAIEYCNKNRMIYILCDVELITLDTINYLANTNKIIFLKKYQEKFITYKTERSLPV